MIYTVTFNPALDFIVGVDNLRLGQINRTSYEKILPGGKGINVSIVLGNLGHTSVALGFAAGFTGQEIQARTESYGVKCDFIQVAHGLSRINVKIKSDQESEINGQGPKISEADVKELFSKLDNLVANDVLVVSGSIPSSMPADIYERIMEQLAGRDIRIVVDATRDLLTNVLPYHPWLIKPNNHELGEIFGVELSTRDSVIPYAKKLQDQGASNVLVSMAGEGAVLVAADGSVTSAPAPKGTVINSVGAGDSMVAGFVAGYLEHGNYLDAFKMGVSCGSASAFSDELTTRSEAEALLATL
jgi:1-phosphofructokinase